MSVTRLTAVSFLTVSSVATLAHGDASDDEGEDHKAAAVAAAREDAFTPGLTRSSMYGRAITTATLTVDGARDISPLDLNGELQVFGPIRLVLRVDNVFGAGGGNARPGIGAAVQLLYEDKHGVALSTYLAYKAEGFTEGEGEIEGLASFGKQLGWVHGTLNLAYGQDPEGNERDGEAALGLHVEPIRGLFAGVMGRFRDALGSDGDKGTGVVRDALAAVTATYVIGRFGLTASFGYGGVETVASDSMHGGSETAFTLGAVF